MLLNFVIVVGVLCVAGLAVLGGTVIASSTKRKFFFDYLQNHKEGESYDEFLARKARENLFVGGNNNVTR